MGFTMETIDIPQLRRIGLSAGMPSHRGHRPALQTSSGLGFRDLAFGVLGFRVLGFRV